ncbi:MAG: hypothetical protein RBR08_11960 [Desulforegulaceae bacterium]|nr:hypothetical protein [Desulforegulaceae bacterium]
MKDTEFKKIIQAYKEGFGSKIIFDPGDELFLFVALAVKYNFCYRDFCLFFKELEPKQTLSLATILDVYYIYFSSNDEKTFRIKVHNKISKKNIEAVIFSVFLTGVKLEKFSEWIK